MIEIPFKLPSLNDYISKCRANKYVGAKFKYEVEADLITIFRIQKVPIYNKPVKLHFLWIEENRKRDCDNIASAKKFILDALVKNGNLKNDNQRWVRGFTDDFDVEDKAKVIIEIEEVEE